MLLCQQQTLQSMAPACMLVNEFVCNSADDKHHPDQLCAPVSRAAVGLCRSEEDLMQEGSRKGEQGSLNQVDTGEMAGMPKDAKPPSASPAEHHFDKRQGVLHLPDVHREQKFCVHVAELHS